MIVKVATKKLLDRLPTSTTLNTISQHYSKHQLDQLAYGFYDATHHRNVQGDEAILILGNLFFYDNYLDISGLNTTYKLSITFKQAEQVEVDDEGNILSTRLVYATNEKDSGSVGTKEFKSGFKSNNRHVVYSSEVESYQIIIIEEKTIPLFDTNISTSRYQQLYENVDVSSFNVTQIKQHHKNYDAPRSKRGWSHSNRTKPQVDTRLSTPKYKLSHYHKHLEGYFSLSTNNTSIVVINKYGNEGDTLAVFMTDGNDHIVCTPNFNITTKEGDKLWNHILKYLSEHIRVRIDKYVDEDHPLRIDSVVIRSWKGKIHPINISTIKNVGSTPIFTNKSSTMKRYKKGRHGTYINPDYNY